MKSKVSVLCLFSIFVNLQKSIQMVVLSKREGSKRHKGKIVHCQEIR